MYKKYSTAMCLPVLNKQNNQHGQKRLMDISNVQFMHFLNISFKNVYFMFFKTRVKLY